MEILPYWLENCWCTLSSPTLVWKLKCLVSLSVFRTLCGALVCVFADWLMPSHTVIQCFEQHPCLCPLCAFSCVRILLLQVSTSYVLSMWRPGHYQLE